MNRDYVRCDELMHIGVARRSGRYPWGSGKESYQRTADFLARIDDLKKSGLTEKEIAQGFELTTSQLRTQLSLAKAERRSIEHDKATSLRARGYSLNEIAKEMGYANDSSVRSLLNEKTAQRMDQAQNIAATLKKNIDEKGMIDVGVGIEREFGVSTEKLKQALYILELEGYPTYTGGVSQTTNAGKQTTIKVIGPPGTQHKDIFDPTKINTVRDYNTMNGDCNVDTVKYPASLDINRIKVRYAEDGGITKDGTIEIRRGVKDLSLGNSHYAQVRILTDGDRYLKGMAVYKDDDNFPPGIDVIFNTNKSNKKSPREVFKDTSENVKKDPSNPFGAALRREGQYTYTDTDGQVKLSPINKTRHEGDWNDWSNGLPSQFLAKQSRPMIEKQLNLSKADKLAELDEIMSIDNPTIKKHYLASFAEDADSAAVHLKAASLPRQRYQVILPIDSMKDNEVYAPNYKDGESVALIRYPHGGTFEIPILTVNNKNKDAINMITKNAKDAVCINSKNAELLSGADFDGDFVMVIPSSGSTKVTSKKPLEGLKGFDNKAEYPARPGMKVMQKGTVGREMGVISNLITDMTLGGANDEELTRAVKHSMVVIDAYKHKLDYKKSEADNGIAALQKRYQPKYDENGNQKDKGGGASTLLSRAKGEERVDKRVGTPKINLKDKEWYDPTKPEGALIYNKFKNVKSSKDYDPTQPEGVYITRKQSTYTDKKGKVHIDQYKSTKMAEADDARKLSSGTPQEELYADYANALKAMANTARKNLATTPRLKYSPEAKKEYSVEEKSLKAKLNNSLMNAPRERQAILLANSRVSAQIQANPDLKDDKETLKKLRQQAISSARVVYGAKRDPIEITDREWEAIQKGAVTENVLSQILLRADADALRARATPKDNKTLSEAKLYKLTAMKTSGYTNEEIAKSLGVSATTVVKYL